jgi:hypothetical protein
MTKKGRGSKRASDTFTPIPWLPIDSRIIPFLSFPHVRGIARVFLLVEMILCTFVVVGTVILVSFALVAR